MKYFIFLLLYINIFAQNDFYFGIDVSSYKKVIESNGILKYKGFQKDALEIFKENNFNFIRLKLWHSPSDGFNDLDDVIDVSKKAKNLGFKILLDIHYSDTWADPGHQTKPNKWQNLNYDVLRDSVYNYTKYVISSMKQYNCLPNIVQIGNEISGGFLWDDGRLDGSVDKWKKFTNLLKDAISGVKDALSYGDSIKIMIHTDKGGDFSSCQWFFDNLLNYGVNFDIIGLSYYPWWQGDFTKLNSNLFGLSNRYNKEIIIVETAYPFTLLWNDDVFNVVGSNTQLLANYEASADGQRRYLTDLVTLLMNYPKVKGIFYWEPAWISTQKYGSMWENCCLFDFNGDALPGINYANYLINNEIIYNKNNNKIKIYPNPFNGKAKISFTIFSERINVNIYDLLGHCLKSKEILNLTGKTVINLDFDDLSSGIYIISIIDKKDIYVQKVLYMK